MYKSTKKLTFIALIAMMFIFASQAYSQVPANTFGLNASFATEWSNAGVCYTLSSNTEVGVGLMFINKSYTVESGTAPDAESTIGFNAYGVYYLAKADVNPYLMLQVDYAGYPKETSGSSETTNSSFSFEFAFGGNSFITKGLAIYAHIGLRYNMYSSTTKYNTIESTHGVNTLSLFNSAVGATFYF